MILEKVHGAEVLGDLFSEFSEARYTYNKVEHGIALTRLIIEHAPDELLELAEFLSEILDKAPDKPSPQA